MGLKMSLGALLKSKRTALGLSIEDVAETAGCSKSHYYGVESDRSEPGILLCVKLSLALSIPVNQMASAVLSGALKSAKAGNDSVDGAA